MLFANRGPRPLATDIASKPVKVICPGCFVRLEVSFSELSPPARVYRGVCSRCGAHTITEVSTRSSRATGEIFRVTKIEEMSQ